MAYHTSELGLCVCVCMYNTQPQRGDGKPAFWAISTILPHSLSRLEGRCCFLSWELTIPNGDAECKQMSLSLGPLHFSAVPVKQGLMELLLKGRGDSPWSEQWRVAVAVREWRLCQCAWDMRIFCGRKLLGWKTPSPGVSSFVASRWWVLIDAGVLTSSEAAQSFFSF